MPGRASNLESSKCQGLRLFKATQMTQRSVTVHVKVDLLSIHNKFYSLLGSQAEDILVKPSSFASSRHFSEQDSQKLSHPLSYLFLFAFDQENLPS